MLKFDLPVFLTIVLNTPARQMQINLLCSRLTRIFVEWNLSYRHNINLPATSPRP